MLAAMSMTALTAELERQPEVEVAWLYGSRARGDAAATSDVDLAIAFRLSADASHAEPWERIDDLRARLQAATPLEVSVVDINRAPTPLALNIVNEGKLVVCHSDLRLRTEEQRVWSLWEAYRREHERNRPPL